MKEKFEEYLKKLSTTAFDVVAGPTLLVAIGVPLILAAAAAVICFFAVRAIIRISKKKKAEKSEEC